MQAAAAGPRRARSHAGSRRFPPRRAAPSRTRRGDRRRLRSRPRTPPRGDEGADLGPELVACAVEPERAATGGDVGTSGRRSVAAPSGRGESGSRAARAARSPSRVDRRPRLGRVARVTTSFRGMRRREIGRPGHPGDSTPRRPTVRTGARSAHRPSGHARPFAAATREDRAPRSPRGCRRAGGRSRPAAPSSRSAPPRSARGKLRCGSAIVRSGSPFAAASWITWWKRSLPRTQSLSSSQRVRPRPGAARAISVSIERRKQPLRLVQPPELVVEDPRRGELGRETLELARTSYASRSSRGVGARTIAPQLCSARFRAPGAAEAPADGVLLTPNSRAIASCRSREPLGISPLSTRAWSVAAS